MAKAKLPVSRAKTAYGLLSDVARIALEEPKRMRMGVWLATERDEPALQFPKCGTVGCIGGWTETLSRPKRGKCQSAESILGINIRQEDELFYPVKLCGEDDQQTPQHATKVARHIRKFQQKYRHQLLAKKV